MNVTFMENKSFINRKKSISNFLRNGFYMKRFALAFMMIFTTFALFAQSDLQVLAVVKLNRNESITVKQLKTRVEAYQKQIGSTLSAEDRKKVLDAMIQEKLVLQAATKAGLSVTDSAAEEYFLQTVSQSIGRKVTEQEFEQIVKQQTNLSLDEYMKQQSGMSVSDYKAYLKSQMIAQQYILSQRQNELQQVAATDEEIRGYYELNKTSFVWNDMIKLYIVSVPAKENGKIEDARVRADDLYNKLKNKKITTNQLTVDSRKDGADFQAGEALVNKSQLSAQQLGVNYATLLEIFNHDKGWISPLDERESGFMFYTITNKYGAKMLALSDVVEPDTTITVYDYIKNALGQQKRMEYLTKAAQEIAAELDVSGNVERKKKDAELDKLLSW